MKKRGAAPYSRRRGGGCEAESVDKDVRGGSAERVPTRSARIARVDEVIRRR